MEAVIGDDGNLGTKSQDPTRNRAQLGNAVIDFKALSISKTAWP